MSPWKPDEAVNALMDRFARPCIRLHRPFPPPRSQRGRSKLGGLPNLPSDLEWPYGGSPSGPSRGRIPLHFLAQIDCRELPRGGAGLPAAGMLYFFANTDDAADWSQHDPDDFRRVLYAPHVAPDQAVRLPPADIPDIGPRKGALGGVYPNGYGFGHLPDDPLARKVYFEWPVQFVEIDSYPPADAVRKTPEWAKLAAAWEARSKADKSFSDEYGDEGALLDIYQEGSRERMHRALYAALDLPEPAGYSEYIATSRKWRQVSEEIQGAFPPIAAFASEIAVAIDHLLADEIAKVAGMEAPVAAEAANGPGGFFRRLIGLDPSPPTEGEPDWAARLFRDVKVAQRLQELRSQPDWLEDLKIVRQEAANWLLHMRVLAPGHVLDAEERERFLAWLDDLEDRNWARIDGHRPQVRERVGFAFDQAMFQLARLAASREAIRRHFPDELYRMYSSYIFQGYAWHQMLGWFPSSQEPRPISDARVPLLMLSYDRTPGFRFCDAGELQFFIKEGDLKAGNFRFVEAQMQGG
jgi:uncharacterized protein YwqG